MAGLVPRDAPDPDGDRRFAERPFPLLEPAGWNGERHRGGYGVRDPGSVTTSLGLIFGPWDPFVSVPRLAISVGSEFPIDLTRPEATFLLHAQLVSRREELLHRPRRRELGTIGRVRIRIEGEVVELDALRRRDRWLGRGQWKQYTVEIHALDVAPQDVRLHVTDRLPAR